MALFADTHQFCERSRESYETKKQEKLFSLEVLENKIPMLEEHARICKELIETEKNKIALEKELVKEKIENRSYMKEMNENLRDAEKIRNELQEFNKKYEKLLGLELEIEENSVLFKILHVSLYGNNENYVKLKLGDGTVELEKCEPYIEKIEEFVENLKKTADLNAFLKNVRKGFKHLYN